ncbi:MAG: hypothetical protein FJ128_03225 [Deltaproteobacteria bacterium]|nr:hypothetical protein [Deltaproteobacteria bacterium]
MDAGVWLTGWKKYFSDMALGTAAMFVLVLALNGCGSKSEVDTAQPQGKGKDRVTAGKGSGVVEILPQSPQKPKPPAKVEPPGSTEYTAGEMAARPEETLTPAEKSLNKYMQGRMGLLPPEKYKQPEKKTPAEEAASKYLPNF